MEVWRTVAMKKEMEEAHSFLATNYVADVLSATKMLVEV